MFYFGHTSITLARTLTPLPRYPALRLPFPHSRNVDSYTSLHPSPLPRYALRQVSYCISSESQTLSAPFPSVITTNLANFLQQCVYLFLSVIPSNISSVSSSSSPSFFTSSHHLSNFPTSQSSALFSNAFLSFSV